MCSRSEKPGMWCVCFQLTVYCSNQQIRLKRGPISQQMLRLLNVKVGAKHTLHAWFS